MKLCVDRNGVVSIYFISNYAKLYGMPQPAAPRGRDGLPQLSFRHPGLKMALHSLYEAAQKETGGMKS